MTAAPDTPSTSPGTTEAELRAELRGLMQFVHLAPVGLIQSRIDGQIKLMNPMATQLLATLDLTNGSGDGSGELNLFDILDKASPDLRTLVQTFKRTTGVICDHYRILMPETHASLDAPIALGITALMLPGTLDCLMVVLTDESAHIKLQRMKASWAPT